MIAAAAALIIPALAVWAWLRVLRLRFAGGSRLAAAAISFALGVGLSSVVAMWMVMLGMPLNTPFVVLDAALWSAAAALGVWRLRLQKRSGHGAARSRMAHGSPPARLTAADRVIRVLFVLVITLAAATAIAEYVGSPHGQWDAWAMWNQKARFFIRAGDRWTDALTIEWAQPGHPLLVSISVARMWAYAGMEPTAAPAMLAALTGVAIVAGVMGALDPRRRVAWIAGAVVAAPATFIHEVMSQQADIPVGMFIVLTLVALWKRRPSAWRDVDEVRGALLVGGALAGLSAWTKNEGLLFFAVASIVVVPTMVSHRRPKDVAWWVAGAVPGLVTAAGFKAMFAPSTPLYFSSDSSAHTLMGHLLALDEHSTIVNTIGMRWLDWGGPLTRGALPLALIAAVLAAFPSRGRSGRAALATVVVMLTSYYAVWLLSPLETVWLVNTTFERLVAQVWPALVLAACAFDPAPELPPGSLSA